MLDAVCCISDASSQTCDIFERVRGDGVAAPRSRAELSGRDEFALAMLIPTPRHPPREAALDAPQLVARRLDIAVAISELAAVLRVLIDVGETCAEHLRLRHEPLAICPFFIVIAKTSHDAGVTAMAKNAYARAGHERSQLLSHVAPALWRPKAMTPPKSQQEQRVVLPRVLLVQEHGRLQ